MVFSAKKILIIIGLVSFFACDGVENVNPEPAEPAEILVPKVVVEAIKAEFTDASEIKVAILQKEALFQAHFTSQAEALSAIVTQAGKIKEINRPVDSVKVQRELPDLIRVFLEKTYPNSRIERFETLLEGRSRAIIGYKILLLTRSVRSLLLTFDGKGAQTASLDLAFGRADSNRASIVFINESEYPEFFTRFIRENHPNHKVLKAAMSLSKEKITQYFISLTDGNILLDIVFDANGKVLNISKILLGGTIDLDGQKALDPKEITEKMRTFLNKNFVGWQFERGFKIIKTGKIVGFSLIIIVPIALNQQPDIYQIEFDENEIFVGARKL